MRRDCQGRGDLKRDILLIDLAVFLWGAGEGLFYTIQPLYIKELGANPAQIGGVLSLMGLATALTYVPLGHLSDRLPRKTLLLGGWGMGLVAVLLFAVARDWRGLIPGLVLYGLSASCVPVVNAYLATAAGGRNLESVFTRNLAAYTTGAVLFPVVGGLLAEARSMRWVYLAAAGVLALSMAAVLGASSQAPAAERSRRGGWRLLRGPAFVQFAAVVLLLFFSMYLVFPLAPNFLEDARGLSKAHVGALGSVAAIGTTLFSLGLGRLRGRWRPRALLLGQGAVWLSIVMLLWGPGMAGATLGFLLRGGCHASQALIQARGGNLLGEAHRGLALGATGTVVVVAQMLASAVAGRLYVGAPSWPFVAALALIPASVLVTTVRLAGDTQA